MMKIALLMNQNAYAGREYLSHLLATGLHRRMDLHVLTIGDFPERNPVEEERCEGLWLPPSQETLLEKLTHKHFDSLKSPLLLECLQREQYALGLQGGAGILKPPVIEAFQLGILSFHPGALPQYRGCSAPEWQLSEGKPVVSTCHLIAPGIDSGAVYDMRALNLNLQSYAQMRAGIYPETARFMVDVLSEILQAGGFVRTPQPQDESLARYRPYIGEAGIAELKQRMALSRFDAQMLAIPFPEN